MTEDFIDGVQPTEGYTSENMDALARAVENGMRSSTVSVGESYAIDNGSVAMAFRSRGEDGAPVVATIARRNSTTEGDCMGIRIVGATEPRDYTTTGELRDGDKVIVGIPPESAVADYVVKTHAFGGSQSRAVYSYVVLTVGAQGVAGIENQTTRGFRAVSGPEADRAVNTIGAIMELRSRKYGVVPRKS